MTSPLDHVLFHLRDALATDPRVGELGLEVTCDGDRTVVVRGMVSTEQRRSHIFVVAADVLRVHHVEFDVRNDTEVTVAHRVPRTGAAVIRVAAVGDVHLGRDSDDALERSWAALSDEADALLLAGDLTKCGTVDEALVVADHLRRVTVPVVAVLGNHDHHDGRPEQVGDVLRAVGVDVLDGTTVTLDIDGACLGIAGIKGFGGGFAGANASAFGEAEMKAFVHHAEEAAARLGDALAELDQVDCAARIALTHYSPVRDTLDGEPTEIYPFLGSQLLAEAIDAHRVDLALHGHAHAGVENGSTAGGVPVRNVAMPVIRSAYRVFVVGA